MSDLSRNLKPDAYGTVNSFIAQELSSLEYLFNDPGLIRLRRRVPEHPAVIRYDFAKTYLIKAPTLQYPDESETVIPIGSLILDRLAQASARLDQSFWALVGDQNTQKEIKARLLKPSQFRTQLSVLNCWSLLRSKDFVAEVVEKTGFPDIVLNPRMENETWLEVKHIQPGTNPSRVRRVIVKANSQIKRAASEGAGILFLYLERPEHRFVFDDATPADVQPYLAEVEREIRSGFSKSVAQVIIVWDDYMIVGDPPEPTAYFFRRVSKVLEHPTPRHRPMFPGDALQLGRTVMTSVRWTPSQSPRPPHLQSVKVTGLGKDKNIVVSPLFRQESEVTDHIRAAHAISVLQNPDGIETFDLSEANSKCVVILATRGITLGHHPYTLLVLSTERESNTIEIALGFRLYEDDAEQPKIWLHPLDTFLRLLTLYGVAVKVGNQTELWIPKARIDLPADGQLVQVQLPKGESFILSAIAKINDTNPKTADIAWAFAIRSNPYRADLRRHRR